MFERAVGECGEALQRGFAVGIEADVLPILSGASVAVVGDGGAGEVEGAAVGGGDDFDGVGVMDVLRRAEDPEGGDFDVRMGEGTEQGGEVVGAQERFVALYVDVDFGVDELRDGMDAVGPAGEVGRGELDGPVVFAAECNDLFGIGGDDEMVELGAGTCGLVDPGEHRAPGYGA